MKGMIDAIEADERQFRKLDAEITALRADLKVLAVASEDFHEAVALGPLDGAAKYGPDFDLAHNVGETARVLREALALPNVADILKEKSP